MELKEPKLTYERVLNDVSATVQNDLITAACLHAKFIIVGYRSGRINVFDHQGNRVNSRDLCLHLESVNSISIDKRGDYFVSCSNESLVIYGLCDDTHNHVSMLDKAINVVAIDPAGGKRYVTGDDKLTLHELKVNYIDKLKGSKPCVLLNKDKQPVRSVSWHGKFIACATDKTILVFYDPPREKNSVITRIRKDDEVVGSDAAQFSWKDNRTLLIGWGNTVKVCLIKNRPLNELTDRIPRLYVEIISMFDTDYIIHGLAPLGKDLLTLTFQPLDKSLNVDELQVQVLEIFSNRFNEVSGDLLKVRAMQSKSGLERQLASKTAKLLSLHTDEVYLIVCPQDIIYAKPRDDDDHFEWLIEHDELQECYEFAVKSTSRLVRHSLREIEELYMDHLLAQESSDDYARAAELCASVCGSNQEQWDEAIQKFLDLNQLGQLLPHLPKCLKTESYDFILDECLRNDSISFFKAIKELPSNLYSLKKITDNVIGKLNNDPKNLVLNEALAELYTRDGRLEEAVQIYLDYNDKTKIFDLIRTNGLVSSLEKNTDRLMQVDADETAQLLVENMDAIPIKSVVDKFSKYKSHRYLIKYLHRLVVKDRNCCIEYHDLMIKLYSEYQPESLLNFLKLSTSYRLDEAVELCKGKNLIKEVVFLYSRMGDLREALRYIVEEKDDIHEAIEFCKEHQDPELWHDLITHTVEKRPDYIGILLKNVGTHIDDPAQLIDRIPSGCEIDGLMPALRQILQDYELQIDLEKSLRKLQAEDAFNLLEKQMRLQTKGILIKDTRLCDHCNQILIPDQLRDENLSQTPEMIKAAEQGSSNDIVVFGCHHVFHEDCCTDTQQPGVEGPNLQCRVCLQDRADDIDS